MKYLSIPEEDEDPLSWWKTHSKEDPIEYGEIYRQILSRIGKQDGATCYTATLTEPDRRLPGQISSETDFWEKIQAI
ncbi:9857_t:CDS:2 [Scutellospora calospora]|uniref:9857_t:CDS:1 n=1 Tax=Scutellospora calospora TaxID=85575 RepID=A0ACA9JUP4_9GLOM|nr:9857_t:CDS:2 [Scutellospora calospora]